MAETKICQNCENSFEIADDDFAFYEKMQVPAPKWCRDCRQQRRYAYRNERTLYRRECDLCKKSTVTIYSPNKPYKVYCVSCWWGDAWDPAAYGRDFDFSRPFFEQFSALQHEVPRMALLTKNSINSEYTNHCGENKNAYICFATFTSENVSYCNWTMNSRDCCDCGWIYEKGERLYECIDSQYSYQSQYCLLLNNSSNCFYCYDVSGSSDCFLSCNIRGGHYIFKNQQLAKEEYQEKIKQYDLSKYSVRVQLFNEFKEMMSKDAVHKYMQGERTISSLGSLLFNCKNVVEGYECDKCEDSKYIYGTLGISDSMDIYHAGIKSEGCYELHGCVRAYNLQFCHLCYDNSHLQYCDSCQNSQNLFGCVSVKKGEYMIFNKRYSKEEYEALKAKIIEHMKSTGEYGEYFPPSIAPVYYNETRGAIYMPLSKEEVLARGWQWEEKIPGVFGKGTVTMQDVPDSITDITDEYISNIFTCETCTKNFNIIPDELVFYKREKVPLPRKCADCREKVRISLRLPRKLYTRSCSCVQEGHDHAGKCVNQFESAYAPDRTEKVYCEQCYQKEVL